MLGNHYRNKEIGYYINETNNDSYSQTDLNEIISFSKTVFSKIDEKTMKNKRSKEVFQNLKVG